MSKSVRAGFLCITGRTLLREKYLFIGNFGNTNSIPPGGRRALFFIFSLLFSFLFFFPFSSPFFSSSSPFLFFSFFLPFSCAANRGGGGAAAVSAPLDPPIHMYIVLVDMYFQIMVNNTCVNIIGQFERKMFSPAAY